jgi:peroxiredoxin
MASRRVRHLVEGGSRAPDFRLKRLDGGESGLTELTANGPILLVFFKISCPVCQFTLPFLERIHAGGRLRVVGVSQNDAEDTLEFHRQFGISFPALLDSDEAGYPASNAYGISSVPTSFLVEHDGIISRVVEGWQKTQIQGIGGFAGVNPFRPGEHVPEWKSG